MLILLFLLSSMTGWTKKFVLSLTVFITFTKLLSLVNGGLNIIVYLMMYTFQKRTVNILWVKLYRVIIAQASFISFLTVDAFIDLSIINTLILGNVSHVHHFQKNINLMELMKVAKEKDTRCRNWTCVVYPESAPDNWRIILDDMHIEWIESPLHDKDLNATGEPKKAHWHLLLLFGGVKSYDQVKSITDVLNAPIPQRCHNAKSMVRYMAHIDNPDKYQYSIADIKGHGGVDLDEFFRTSASERYSIISDIIDYIRGEGITEFQDIIDYAQTHERDTWFPLLCDNSAYIVERYIKSQRHRFKCI